MTAALTAPERAAIPPSHDQRRRAAVPLTAGRTRALLGAILVLALALRVWSLDWSLPWAFHFDEALNYVERAERMVATGNPNPRYFQNPTFFTYQIAAGLLVARALGPLAGPFGPDAVAPAYLLARLLSALSGVLTVALVFGIGSRLYGRAVGLAGALFLAVSFIHVRDSHYGVNDVPGLALLMLSVWAAARLLRAPALRWYLLAGLAGGLATATKYNMGFFFIPIVAAHLLAERPDGRRWWQPSALVPLVLAGGASALGFLLGTPYALLDARRFRAGFSSQLELGNDRYFGQEVEPVPLLYAQTLGQGIGVLALALALLGAVLALRRRRAATALLLSLPLVYLAFMLPKALFFARFGLPLVPFLCVLAGYAVVALAERVRPSRRPAVAALVLLAAVAQPLLNDVRHNLIVSRTDTRVQAGEWVQANLPRGSRVWIETMILKDAPGRAHTPNAAELRFEQSDDDPSYDARYFASRGYEYVITSSFSESPLPGEAPLDRLHRSLEAEARLVARFAPGHGNRELPYSQEDIYTPFWNLGERERPGPIVSVYALEDLIR